MQSLLGRGLTPEEQALEDAMLRVLALEKRPARAALREIAARSPGRFFAAALTLLETESDPGPQHRLYTQLLECPEFLEQLVNPERFSRAQLLRVCRWLKETDDFLDLRLARMAPGRHGDVFAVPAEQVLRLLDVLHEISSGPRLVQILSHLPNHPDERVASKAAMLLGHRLRSEHWLRNQVKSNDARVRASVVEGLWGVNTPYARKCLWDCAKDGNNRVVGNALFGLHLLGEPAVDRSVEKMLRDARPNFRRTAAWLMGRIGKAEFADALQRASNDVDAGVRETAVRALRALPVATVEISVPQPAEIPALLAEQGETADGETSPTDQPAAIPVPNFNGRYIRGL